MLGDPTKPAPAPLPRDEPLAAQAHELLEPLTGASADKPAGQRGQAFRPERGHLAGRTFGRVGPHRPRGVGPKRQDSCR